MNDRCKTCTEKCPQADMAHQAAMGRMYATNEFINLQKKIDSGELVEVVRCRDCKHYMTVHCTCDGCCISDDWYCADGERRTDHV